MSSLRKFLDQSQNDEEKWGQLLEEIRLTKDSVVKRDIWLTQTEIDVIDAPEFQRLRGILQLGPAHLIYKDATHTRFSHSIGTLYWAQRIIEAINRNFRNYHIGQQLSNKSMFLTHLAALLHDFVYICFGHILEDEGHILPGQWDDKERVQKLLLSNDSKVRKAITTNVIKAFGNEKGKEIAEMVVNVVVQILSADKEKDIRELGDMAFVVDIVHNTICADLLDYLERDIWFTGTFGDYDRRLVSYFTIQNYNNHPRVVMKLYKKSKNDMRVDVVDAILDCLRLRYRLAAYVYFHHTRREASSMIIKMVSAAIKAGVIGKDKLYEIGDSTLIDLVLGASGSTLKDEPKECLETAKRLALRYKNRQLYKPLHELGREEYCKSEITLQRLEELIDWERRYDFETTLEGLVGIESGGVILYIPDKLLEKREPEMGLKEAQVLVETKYGIETLEKLGERSEFKLTIGDEIENLKSKHKALFKASLYVSQDVLNDPRHRRLKHIAENWLEAKEPIAIVSSILEKSQIRTDEQVELVASRLQDEFQRTPFAPTPKICSLRRFVESANASLSTK
jgi:HD superfamily phosphohydrolase